MESGGEFVGSELTKQLADKTITKEELLEKAEKDPKVVPMILQGVSSPKAAVRYGCARVLMDLSDKHPEQLYPYFDFFVELLDSKYRILTWNAMAIIAYLTRVDEDGQFDAVFDKYYSFLNDDYMVTVANVVGHSGRIANAKPYLVDRIADELLKVDKISTTPHLTEECRRVIAEKAIESLDLFFDKITQKKRVISFVEAHADSSRKSLRTAAERFLKRRAN